MAGMGDWRREWDSNPRYGFPHTRFPSVRLKPLGHLSGRPLLAGRTAFCKPSSGSAGKKIGKPLVNRAIPGAAPKGGGDFKEGMNPESARRDH